MVPVLRRLQRRPNLGTCNRTNNRQSLVFLSHYHRVERVRVYHSVVSRVNETNRSTIRQQQQDREYSTTRSKSYSYFPTSLLPRSRQSFFRPTITSTPLRYFSSGFDGGNDGMDDDLGKRKLMSFDGADGDYGYIPTAHDFSDEDDQDGDDDDRYEDDDEEDDGYFDEDDEDYIDPDEESKRQREMRKLELKKEFQNKKGRGWSDDMDMEEVLMSNLQFEDLQDWTRDWISQTSRDRVQIHPDKIPTLSQLARLPLPPKTHVHPGHGNPKEYTAHRRRVIFKHISEAVRKKAEPMMDYIQSLETWDAKQDAVDKLFEGKGTN